jgi:histidinol-phosphatase (PHP family)
VNRAIAKQGMHSHHSHSGQFCSHAVGTLEEVVQEAIVRGFVMYGLTEHVPRYREIDLYPEEVRRWLGFLVVDLIPSLSITQRELSLTVQDLDKRFNAFLREAHRLRVKYKSQITILVGLETESISSLDLDQLEALLERHAGQVDYIVGSIHHVNEIPIDFDLDTYNRCLESFEVSGMSSPPSASNQLGKYLAEYFSAQNSLIKRFKPPVIGHADLCRLYTPDLHFRDFPEAYTQLEANIIYATGYGALFEVNAAAFRKGWDDAYPGTDVVEVSPIIHNTAIS